MLRHLLVAGLWPVFLVSPLAAQDAPAPPAPPAPAAPAAPSAPAAPAAPRELGRVAFGHDIDAALGAAKHSHKPVFLLFQEIPGCSTCTGFGDQVLSHPLLVEAIEDEFVPVAIRNNEPGAAAAILERLQEPAWNNPVVRFLDADGKDLLPRKDGVWTVGPIAERMLAALRTAGRAAPAYLSLAAQEAAASQEHATFAMHCFWEGEARLGALEGVTATRPAHLAGEEVVEVTFDPDRIAYTELLAEAEQLECATTVFADNPGQLAAARELVGDRAVLREGTPRDAVVTDHKHALAASSLRFLPLTPMQQSRVNAALAAGKDTAPWLSPRQQALAARIAKALAAEPDRLDGLARPDEVTALAGYEAKLRARLDAAERAR